MHIRRHGILDVTVVCWLWAQGWHRPPLPAPQPHQSSGSNRQSRPKHPMLLEHSVLEAETQQQATGSHSSETKMLDLNQGGKTNHHNLVWSVGDISRFTVLCTVDQQLFCVGAGPTWLDAGQPACGSHDGSIRLITITTIQHFYC